MLAYAPDMKDWLAPFDLIYEKAPIEWETGIPLANGDIGALIWGDGNPLKVTLDKYDAWELRSPTPTDPRYNYKGLRQMIENKQFAEAKHVFVEALRGPNDVYPTRLPMPRMELRFSAPAEGFNARLHLHDAKTTGSLRFPRGSVNWEAFVHSQTNLLVLHLGWKGLKSDTASRPLPPAPYMIKVGLDHLNQSAKDTLKKWGYPDPEQGQNGEYKWLRQRFPAGGEYVTMWRQISQEPGEIIILLTIATHNDADNPLAFAQETLANTVGALLATPTIAGTQPAAPLQKISDEHVKFWHEFWQKSFLTIPDARLENLFYAEMYKLVCCSRPKKYPCSLQGLWTKDGGMPPWSGDYHLDINVEETYWPVYTSNHLELGMPLYERFWQNLPRFKQMCYNFFGFEGAWSRCEMGLDGSPIYGYYTTNFWPGNGAWLAHHYWLHWRYSQDKDFLRDRAYPFMRAFMQTYLNLLERGDDGRYHLPLSNSPEWGEGDGQAWSRDPTCDLALIRWLASALLETVNVLDVNDADAPRWKEMLEKLTDYPQDNNGLQIFRGQPLTASHRHHSHLMAIHPLGILNIEGSDADRNLIARSLGTLCQRGTSAWTGWSFPWTALIAARANQPYLAWHMLQLYFYFIKPNSFHINNDPRQFGVSQCTDQPMTLEAGFCAAAAIMEILIQSWGGIIRVFPAIPEFWSDAYFHQLRAEGAFLVTARLKEGKVRFVEITSEKGGRCRLKNPFEPLGALLTATTNVGAHGGATTNVGAPHAAPSPVAGQIIEFSTVAGESYRLLPEGAALSAEDFSISKPRRLRTECHWFGVKQLPRFY